MRWTSKSKDQITFRGTEEEINKLTRALQTGIDWIRSVYCSELRYSDEKNEWIETTLVTSPALEEPEPLDDPLVAEHFKPGCPKKLDQNLSEENQSPSYFVQHITAAGGNYEAKVVKMEEVGFSCLRSRRGEDGEIWEVWYLPGKWAAQGELKDSTDDQIVKFLCGMGVGQFCTTGSRWGLSLD